MIAYHIDRLSLFEKESIIKLETTSPSILEVFPNLSDGITPHGKKHLSSYKNNPSNVLSSNIELYFELIRQLFYPEKISRLQCFYACKNIESMQIWLDMFRKSNLFPNLKILKVEYNSQAQEFDSSLLKSHISFEIQIHGNINFPIFEIDSIGSIKKAKQYWNGEQSDNPVMELLIKPPVKVLEVIDPQDLR